MCKNLECFFCQELEDRTRNLTKASRIILETENFVVFPTEGCFKIGYLLVMPKQHFLCFGELDPELLTELEEILKKIMVYVRKKSGMSVLFLNMEHAILRNLHPQVLCMLIFM